MDKYTIPRIYKMEPYVKAKPKPKTALSAAKKSAGAIAVTSRDYVAPAYIRPQLKLDLDALKEILNKRLEKRPKTPQARNKPIMLAKR
jgi:hypothetical protein